MTHPQPDHGGSFIRDPRTGALTPEPPAEAVPHAPEVPEPEPAAPQPDAPQKSTPKGGK